MRFRLAPAVAALALTAACSVDDQVNRPPLQRDLELYISVAEFTLLQDDSRPLGAIVRDRNSGQREQGADLSYSSSDAAVAFVDPDGGVLAVSAGTATITVSAHDPYQHRELTQQVAVTVLPNPAVAVEFRPSSLELFVADTVTLATWVLNEDGMDLFRRARRFSVVEEDAQFVSLTESGMATGLAAGTARVIVEAEGFRDTATIVVPGTAPVASVTLSFGGATFYAGDTRSLSVTLKSPRGRVLTDRIVGFSTSNSSVATVDANGVVTAVAPGGARITATSEGKSASVDISVSAIPRTPEIP